MTLTTSRPAPAKHGVPAPQHTRDWRRTARRLPGYACVALLLIIVV
ncbi:hypothetical protein ACTI_50140 [Actinoplanes sp. OR16]|nr:hypothetical protein [Actinoplanes sp. OR16]BBH68329.1 hypothetical protein ACTI_50140 [Actinoplanes sp. OR16]